MTNPIETASSRARGPSGLGTRAGLRRAALSWWAALLLTLSLGVGGGAKAEVVGLGLVEMPAFGAEIGEPEAAVAPVLHLAAATELADQGRVIAKGLASWYGGKFHGRRTASGEPYDKFAFTAAHKTLPFGTLVRVKSMRTGKEVVVRINDRGPYKNKRVIDLSGAAASALGVKARGVSTVLLLRE